MTSGKGPGRSPTSVTTQSLPSSWSMVPGRTSTRNLCGRRSSKPFSRRTRSHSNPVTRRIYLFHRGFRQPLSGQPRALRPPLARHWHRVRPARRLRLPFEEAADRAGAGARGRVRADGRFGHAALHAVEGNEGEGGRIARERRPRRRSAASWSSHRGHDKLWAKYAPELMHVWGIPRTQIARMVKNALVSAPATRRPSRRHSARPSLLLRVRPVVSEPATSRSKIAPSAPP